MKPHSLRKLKQVLRRTYHLFQKKKGALAPTEKAQIHNLLSQLQEQILAQDREAAHKTAIELQSTAKIHLRKTSFEQARDFVFAIGFALFVAVIVRQTWFEFYEIPTGSMRPTLKEQDRLVVSKTDFGINFPLKPEHIYFNPDLVQRGGIFVFTGENMDISDVDTLYFYIFPGKKQYIKRLMGKPGDTLYFYGGRLYGMDQTGNDISQQLNPPELSKIDHVPYIHFEGKVKTGREINGVYSPVLFYQMNEPIARLSYNPLGKIEGTLEPTFQQMGNYSNLWGIKNYAMARLVKRSEIKTAQHLADAPLYLELKHHPSLENARIGFDERGRLRPMLSLQTSYIPLSETHLHTIFDNLYTARFEIKNGSAFRYGANPTYAHPFAPSLSDVPNGTYEFYYGTAYRVSWQGIELQLDPTHPLYHFDPDRVQTLFNLGMEFDTRFAPESKHAMLMPARFAYFRDGALYLMGAPILAKEDPTLTAFVEEENKRPIPFVDQGAPLNPDGTLNIPLIKKYGLKVPPQMYLALGDNYAMSADSRDFGFVPQSNLRGGPDFIFWPPCHRWGAPNQPPYPFFNAPRTLIWTLGAIVATLWYIYHRRRSTLPLNFDK